MLIRRTALACNLFKSPARRAYTSTGRELNPYFVREGLHPQSTPPTADPKVFIWGGAGTTFDRGGEGQKKQLLQSISHHFKVYMDYCQRQGIPMDHILSQHAGKEPEHAIRRIVQDIHALRPQLFPIEPFKTMSAIEQLHRASTMSFIKQHSNPVEGLPRTIQWFRHHYPDVQQILSLPGCAKEARIITDKMQEDNIHFDHIVHGDSNISRMIRIKQCYDLEDYSSVVILSGIPSEIHTASRMGAIPIGIADNSPLLGLTKHGKVHEDQQNAGTLLASAGARYVINSYTEPYASLRHRLESVYFDILDHVHDYNNTFRPSIKR